MKIFLYCAFRNSDGFKESTLDMDSNILSAGCSKESDAIFCNISDNAITLSEDMQQNLLCSINRINLNECGKYINIIFCDNEYDKIINIFSYLLRNYDDTLNKIISAIEKDSDNKETGCRVDIDIMNGIIHSSQSEENKVANISNNGGRLLAYVSLRPDVFYNSECTWVKKLFPENKSSKVNVTDLTTVQGNVDEYISDIIKTIENKKNIYYILLYLGIALAVVLLILFLL